MSIIEIKAPAKINIGLNIVSKRNDGYHNLKTIFYPLNDLYDKITLERSDKFSFTSNNKSLEIENNLIVKTVRLLENSFQRNFTLKIDLKKNIPIGAGLGGGSSDAAAVLISLNEIFELNMNFNKLVDLALVLGSDVPFFIRSKPAIGSSRGEKLEFYDLIIRKPILVVNPRIHVSTKDAFQGIKPKPVRVDYSLIIDKLQNDISWLKKIVNNDFEKTIFSKYPEIGAIKEAMYADNAIYAQMTGSGSTVFGIFDTIGEAEKSSSRLPDEYYKFISCHES